MARRWWWTAPPTLSHLLKVNTDAAGTITAADYWAKGEFLASTDERFRPVMMTPSWDGSVLIVDMYRGVSQDEPIQTDYLKNYIYQHRLWQGIHKGPHLAHRLQGREADTGQAADD